ncbi:MAG: DUF4194 domain-containing protein [Desulfobulbaceae bacterium]|nr:DUF4194 domain-containing protein [Desulfobulbaceae bacterium]
METETATPLQLDSEISLVLIHMLKGVLYQDQQPLLWGELLRSMAPVREYFGLIGLEVFLDESEGYAFLRQREAQNDESNPLPSLIHRHRLSYPVSLLLVLLRKKIVEQDAGGGETRLILPREQLVEMVQVFLTETSNEAKMIQAINQHINKLVEYGFLRRLKGNENQFEVHRIIRALVDGQWLADFNTRMQQYRDHAATLA